MPRADRDLRAIHNGPVATDSVTMEGMSVAHGLPELYRAILGQVAALEAAGHRSEAELLRREAIAAYSRAWDDEAHRRLLHLQTRAARVLEGRERPRRARPARLVLRWSRSV